RQIALGAVGQCVQKVGEAEVLVRGGVKDVLVSNQVVGERKLRRFGAPANEGTNPPGFDAPQEVDAAARGAGGFRGSAWGGVEGGARFRRYAWGVGRDRSRHGALRRGAGARCGNARTARRRCTEPEI